MHPRIAIPQPTSRDLEYNRQNFAAYAEAVRQTGGEPVEFPLHLASQEMQRTMDRCHGLLLTGSPADVDPEGYGHPREEPTTPADAQREATDRLLLEDAFLHRKPILAICFGVQMLNVVHGGTLVQDLTVVPVNHAAGRGVMTAHTVNVTRESLLGSMIDASEAPAIDGLLRLPVNSSHHQAVALAGAGLRIVARCPQDGCVEAVELAYRSSQAAAEHFVLGVQWHPERTTAVSGTSRAIFQRLIAAAGMWASAQCAALSSVE